MSRKQQTVNNGQMNLNLSDLIAQAVQAAITGQANAQVQAQTQAQAQPQPDGYNHQGKPTWFKPVGDTAYNAQIGVVSSNERFSKINEKWYYSLDLDTGTVKISAKPSKNGVGPFRSHSAAQDAMIVLATALLRNARNWRKTDVE